MVILAGDCAGRFTYAGAHVWRRTRRTSSASCWRSARRRRTSRCTPRLTRRSRSPISGAGPVVLAFYPADWSPVCGDQMALYNEVLAEFQSTNAQLLGISVDGAWCHLAFAKERKLHFPLLADFEPKGAVSKKYGAYHEPRAIRARTVRDRREGRDPLELPLADRRQSRRRRHSQGARSAHTRAARHRNGRARIMSARETPARCSAGQRARPRAGPGRRAR